MPDISVSSIFTAIIPVAIITYIGYALRKKDIVDQNIQAALMRLVVWIFTPALIIDRVLGNPLLNDFSAVWKVALAGFLSVALAMPIAMFCARFFGIREAQRKRIFGYCCGIYNYGYVALPICISLCPKDTVGMMLLFNAGLEVAMWSIGVALLNGQVRPRELLKSIINPIFFSMLFCLAFNFIGIVPYVPEWVFGTAKSLGACMIPCGILLVGMSLPVLLNGFRITDEKAISLGATVMRLGLIPALMVLAAVFIPAIPQDLRYILVIQAGMPAAMLPIVVVQYYGGDARIALRTVLSTSAACIITLPCWIKLGFWMLEKFS